MKQNNLEIDKGLPYPLGAVEQNDGVNFALYAIDVQKLTLCFFQEGSFSSPIHEIELNPAQNKTGNIWHIKVGHLPPNLVYGYRLVPRGNPAVNYLLLDPYARLVASNPNWCDHRTEADTPYHPLAKVVNDPPFDWEDDVHPSIPPSELIVYEMHVRGFTRHSSSQVQSPGTYKGIIEKIPYLLELGVNAIELLPIHEFNECEAMQLSPLTKEKLHNYFGYSTINFFSPMNRYASHSDGQNAITEFKTMVRELHKNKIEVILDVVFNHTYEGNEKGPLISFRGLDKFAYYMLDPQGHYLNFSGCGNTFNCNHPVAMELILASLRYWVVEMHVDGFRFDLASILTRAEDGTPLPNSPLVNAITKDPILAQTKLISEPWDAAGLYQVGGFAPTTTRWSDWNGKYRDIVRRFIKGTPGQKNPFATVICGSQDIYGNGRSPCNSINFVTSHDGFSLADLVTYNDKHNLVNGEDNRDGFNYNDSWNCGFEGHSSNKKIIALRERQIRNFIVALLISQGVPMILMGDEYAHTRDGNNNTWCQDNELNWFLWDRLEMRPGFHRFVKMMIQFRKNHPTLRRDTFLSEKDITWHGCLPFKPEWENDNKIIACSLNSSEGSPDLYIAFNASHSSVNLRLPPPENGKAWYWVVNTSNCPPDDFFDEEHSKKIEGAIIRLHSYSSLILEAKSEAPTGLA